MRVRIAADHGDFELKEQIIGKLRDSGFEVEDYGAHSLTPGDDYPDFVIPPSKEHSLKFVLYDMGQHEKLIMSGAIDGIGFHTSCFHIEEGHGDVLISQSGPSASGTEGNKNGRSISSKH
jgi:hypothetical protein